MATIAVACVGLISAVIRTLLVAGMISTPPAHRPELAPYDEKALAVLVWLSRANPAFEYASMREGVIGTSSKYVEHSRHTFAHMVPGILILVLAPFQFNAGLRQRNRRLHRWTGRFMLVMVLFSAWTAIYFGVINPGTAALERPTIAIFGALFLFAAARALYAIRIRDIPTHREWMIRMIAMAIGIGTVRVLSIPVAFLIHVPWETNFVLSMWLGWFVTLAAAEYWIRHTRAAIPRTSVAALAGAA